MKRQGSHSPALRPDDWGQATRQNIANETNTLSRGIRGPSRVNRFQDGLERPAVVDGRPLTIEPHEIAVTWLFLKKPPDMILQKRPRGRLMLEGRIHPACNLRHVACEQVGLCHAHTNRTTRIEQHMCCSLHVSGRPQNRVQRTVRGW